MPQVYNALAESSVSALFVVPGPDPHEGTNVKIESGEHRDFHHLGIENSRDRGAWQYIPRAEWYQMQSVMGEYLPPLQAS